MVGRRAGLGLSIGPKEIVVAPGFALDCQPAGPCAAPAAEHPATWRSRSRSGRWIRGRSRASVAPGPATRAPADSATPPGMPPDWAARVRANLPLPSEIR